MPADIFIASKSDDRPVADKIARFLEQAGFSVWYERVPLGADFAKIIDQQIRGCRIVFALWSRRALKSQWVREQADLASDLGKLAIVRVDNVNLPLGFSNLSTIDLFDADDRLDEARFSFLLEALDEGLGKEKSANRAAFQPLLQGDSAQRTARTFEVLPAAWRTKVFIAHATVDKPRIKPIVEVLLQQNFRIWIDRPQDLGLDNALSKGLVHHRISVDSDWPEQIRRAVKRSHAVLGFWSYRSLSDKRERFHYEMYMGLIQGKLHQCRLDGITESQIGFPWRFAQMANLCTYVPGYFHSELDLLMRDLVRTPILWI